MVLTVSRLFAAFCLLLLVLALRPAMAHPHNEQQEAAEQNQAGHDEAAPHSGMAEAMEHHHGGDADEQRPTTFSGRLVAWLGNMHPFAVHFPIALIPASWLALVLARRRGQAVDVLRTVIVLAGLAAVAAATLGWLNAGFALADEDPVQTWHRWLGTTLAIVAAGIAIWAWRADAVNSRAMAWVLGAVTLLLLVQGWLGATLTHGVEHMMF